MHCLREYFSSKHKKLITNHSASKAQNCQCFDKNLSKTSFLHKMISLIFPLYRYICKLMHQECPFNIFYQYTLLLTNVKQFSNLLKIKKKYVLLF